MGYLSCVFRWCLGRFSFGTLLLAKSTASVSAQSCQPADALLQVTRWPIHPHVRVFGVAMQVLVYVRVIICARYIWETITSSSSDHTLCCWQSDETTSFAWLLCVHLFTQVTCNTVFNILEISKMFLTFSVPLLIKCMECWSIVS